MVGKQKEIIGWLLNQPSDVRYEIKEYKPKRSTNANAYMWVLIGKIADALRQSKNQVYMQMLKDYGQSQCVSVLSSINVDGYFKYYEKIGESKLNDKEFTHYKVYKGSSEYDTNEMSILIDGVVLEAKQMGIETISDDEIEHLKSVWR